MSLWFQFREWVKDHFAMEREDDDVENLVWLEKEVGCGRRVDWTTANTVDYDIRKVKTSDEMIIDIEIKNTEHIPQVVRELLEAKEIGQSN